MADRMTDSMTVAEALRLCSRLKVDNPRLEAEVLLAWVLKRSRAWLYTWPEKMLESQQYALYLEVIARREQGEPVAYIVGEKEFWSLPLNVNSSTLIPRDDTETLVEVALEYLRKNNIVNPAIVDLGCGTGAVALALASELPHARIIAVDKVPEAVSLAAENQQRLGFEHVSVLQSDWFSAIDNATQFNVIVSNPPYIDENDRHLDQGDLRYEPMSALVAADNGLADIQHIAVEALSFLLPKGLLAIEHGWQQAKAVQRILTACGYNHVATHRDLSGNCRVTTGQMR